MERIQKVLAKSGVASRRNAEKMLLEGRISINGKIITELGYKVSSKDIILVDGIEIKKEELVYYVLNKPSGYITSVSDELNRKTVLDLFNSKDLQNRIYPIGRLDFDTCGVLLFTNDGEFTNYLTNPKSEIEKEYLARIEGLVIKEDLRKMAKGVIINDNYLTKKCFVKLEEYNRKENSSLVRIIITEGKYHQVKLMFKAVGYEVKKLTRIRFGCVTLEGIMRGTYRRLKIHEIKKLIGEVKRNG